MIRRYSRLILVLICLAVIFAVSSSSAAYDPWKFAVVCDTRGDDNDIPGKKCINEYILKVIAQSIVDENCELVIVPGDMVNGWCANGNTPYDQQFQNWKDAMKPVYDKNIPVYTVRGNHENGSIHSRQPPYMPIANPVLKDAYLEALGKENPKNGPEDEKGLTYYFTYKNAFFVGLDQYIHPNRVNIVWLTEILKERLDRKQTPHLFTFGHDPAFQVNHPDCLAFYKRERDQLWDLIGSKGSRIYFCGHDHLYNRASAQDSSGNIIYQVLVGSCGAPFKPWSPPYRNAAVTGHFHNETEYGYVVVSIDNSKVKAEWKTWDANGDFSWKTLDTFSYATR